MKKILLLLIVSLMIFSCGEEKKNSESTIFKGSIENADTDTITIRKDDFIKRIALNSDGTFTDTLKLPEEGYYTFWVNTERTTVFLSPTKTHAVSLNTKQFDESLEYSGENAAENNYLAQKFLLSEEIEISPQSMVTMPEDSLILLVEDIEQKYLDLLNQGKGVDSAFITIEKKALSFNNQVSRERYALYSENGYYETEGEAPSVEKILVKDIDLDHAENYSMYGDYQQLIFIDFHKETSLLHLKDSASYAEKAFNHIENLESENIKNDLLEYIAYRIQPGSEDSEEIYTRMMAVSIDDKLKEELTKKYEVIKTLGKGNPSPTFTYENHKGGETSLENLQGKYVYIDIWATWCAPCIRQIPALKKIEQKYEGRNIHFVSLSIDTDEAYEKWKEMVTEKDLGGIQLIADNNWESEFIENYAINGIPRFILLDPEGNIVSADAPRPTNPELVNLFESMEI